MIHDGHWAPIEVVERDLPGIDAQVVIDGRQKVPRTAWPFDDILTTLVRGTNQSTRLDATAGPDIGERTRPVITPRL